MATTSCPLALLPCMGKVVTSGARTGEKCEAYGSTRFNSRWCRAQRTATSKLLAGGGMREHRRPKIMSIETSMFQNRLEKREFAESNALHRSGSRVRKVVAAQGATANDEENPDGPNVGSCPQRGSENSSNEVTPSVSRRLLFGGTLGASAAFICPLCLGSQNSSAMAEEWSYGKLSGPDKWKGACASGVSQSPISIPLRATLFSRDPLGALQFRYEGGNPSFLNTGHGTMQVSFPGGANYLEVGGRKLFLRQFHFHAPSEHAVNGVRSDMEVHLVHRDADEKLAVIGVLMEGVEGAPPSSCLEAALKFAPTMPKSTRDWPSACTTGQSVAAASPQSNAANTTGQKLGRSQGAAAVSVDSSWRQCQGLPSINPLSLLPPPDRLDGGRSYVHYSGSLTTPSCTEGVDWFIMVGPVEVPPFQVLEFMRFAGDGRTLVTTSRTLQPLHGRQLFLGP